MSSEQPVEVTPATVDVNETSEVSTQTAQQEKQVDEPELTEPSSQDGQPSAETPKTEEHPTEGSEGSQPASSEIPVRRMRPKGRPAGGMKGKPTTPQGK
ncbi:hypothetical protein EIP91_010955 [Steccherinum ochraceum]|uniref:Uncharacterized protein n=1 Tax=Steccherinum ochraceum TaxID=92696 RepID=A0A4R0R265_9APHY|nr:hypothetical protein EIP91_010955 [Steccherinum ochraceum]